MRTMLICPWFGPLPAWFDLYSRNVKDTLARNGYELLIVTDLPWFRRRVQQTLGITCPITRGSSKIHDYRAAFGVIFQRELNGYDFWGHTDFDCVYGRVQEFWPDDLLIEHDVLTDNRLSYISGPWTLYRNTPEIANAFTIVPHSEAILETPETTGWVEQAFTDHMKETFRFHVEEHHAWDQPDQLHRDGDRLMLLDREVSFFHFRYTKKWPEHCQ